MSPVLLPGALWSGQLPELLLGGLDWLPGLDVPLRRDYYRAMAEGPGAERAMRLADYLACGDSEDGRMCPEAPLPAAALRAAGMCLRLPGAWSRQAVVLLHAGRGGDSSPLHFDWDHGWVLHACLVGTKRMLFFPPSASWLLQPVVNTSALEVGRSPADDREALCEALGGTEIVLHPGEAILFPSLFWHCAVYAEPSAAISVRFETRPGGRPFAALPRSWLLQRLVWSYAAAGYGPEAREGLTACLERFFTPFRTWEDRYWAMMDLYRSLLLARSESRGAATWVHPAFTAELTVAEAELEWSYGSPRRTCESEEVARVTRFLYEGGPPPPPEFAARLAEHALVVRSGLEPLRSLIPILEPST